MTCDGPRVIEFNVRFGDPEAQVVIPMIAGDLAPALVAAAEGELTGGLTFADVKHVGVVLASRGYPGSGPTGLPIAGLDVASALDDVLVFHSGTTSAPTDAGCGPVNGQNAAAGRTHRTLTAGGRVLTVVGRGPTFADARDRAYGAAETIAFDGMHFRRDIGRKALDA